MVRETNRLPSLQQLEDAANFVLTQTDQPVPRWRLLREVLRLPGSDESLAAARQRLLASRWVHELSDTQLPDGSWGRFHSRDSALKGRFPTTELALRRALSLGLDKVDPLIKKSIVYMNLVLDGEAVWSDPPEKHEGWPINIRFITAATLARLGVQNERLTVAARIWVEIVTETFSGGVYSPEAERNAHLRVNGIKTKGKYLKLAGLYPLLLLSIPNSGLSVDLERRLLDWVWHKPDGIYYVYGGCLADPPTPESPHFIDWLEALNLLLRFVQAMTVCTPAITRLWHQCGPNGLWDFGPRAKNGYTLPLSDSWQHPADRKIDCSVAALGLIRRYLPN